MLDGRAQAVSIRFVPHQFTGPTLMAHFKRVLRLIARAGREPDAIYFTLSEAWLANRY